jgi:hypothetical protein
MRRKHPDDIAEPVIDIHAHIKARTVRCDEISQSEVRFTGETIDRTGEQHAEIEAGSATEPHNITDPIQPHVTYSDVRVRWHAALGITDPRGEAP